MCNLITSLEDELRFLTDLRDSVIHLNDPWMSSQSNFSLNKSPWSHPSFFFSKEYYDIARVGEI